MISKYMTYPTGPMEPTVTAGPESDQLPDPPGWAARSTIANSRHASVKPRMAYALAAPAFAQSDAGAGFQAVEA
jgi:hypothetical protein